MIMVFEYMSEYSGMLVAALALLVVQAICDLSLPDYMADIVNTGVLNGNVSFIVQIGGKMLLITLIGAACSIAT
ncbi:MAG: ABC transporter ATP-binding protein, partial [Chloroflexota bacterium]